MAIATVGMILGGAQFGMSLLQAREQVDAAGDQLESQLKAVDARRANIERSAAQASRKRRQQLSDTLSKQQAGLAANGVAGGRTEALLERDAKLRASRERERAGIKQTLQEEQLDIKESQAKNSFDRAITQSQVDLISGGLQAANTMYTAGQQQKATQGK